MYPGSQWVAKNMPLERMGGGQQAKMGGRRHMACYGGGHLLLLWLLGCPPPLLAAKIAFYVIRSFIHHACFTSVIQTHRKITFSPVRVFITFYLAIWLVTTCIALFLLDAGTKIPLWEFLERISQFTLSFLFPLLLYPGPFSTFSTYYFSSISLLP